MQIRQQRHQRRQLVRLQQDIVVVDGVAHRDRKLDLPIFRAGLDDDVHQFAKFRHDRRRNLRVHAGDQADAPAIVEHAQRFHVGAGDAAQAIMQRLQAIDRNAEAQQTGLGRGFDHRPREFVAAGLHRAVHAVVADRTHQRQPVLADESFAADDRNLAGAEFGELAHHVDAFAGAEFLRPAVPGARTAVDAF
jgi:hypothetical protein